MVIEVALM